MKIVIPELNNPAVKSAIQNFDDIEFLPADSLDQAAEMVASSSADSIVSGIDYPTRDVILAYKTYIPLSSNFFSSGVSLPVKRKSRVSYHLHLWSYRGSDAYCVDLEAVSQESLNDVYHNYIFLQENVLLFPK